MNSQPIRILVVDDHPLLREGIAVLLEGQADMQLIGQASNGREGIEQFRAHTPDITLMDLERSDKTALRRSTRYASLRPLLESLF